MLLDTCLYRCVIYTYVKSYRYMYMYLYTHTFVYISLISGGISTREKLIITKLMFVVDLKGILSVV